tara:strand:- start:231 stop:644 length:414 start_codon:yes stop_codon:yes gene_type:complete
MDVASEISLLDSIGIHVYDIISVSVSVNFDLSVSLAQSLIFPSMQIEFVDSSVLPGDYDGCSCISSINFWILKTELARIGCRGPVFYYPRAVFFFSVHAAQEIVERVPVLAISNADDVEIIGMTTIENTMAQIMDTS